jgi:sugar lactone lactonase YvrE
MKLKHTPSFTIVSLFIVMALGLGQCAEKENSDQTALLAAIAIANNSPITTTLSVSGFNKPEAIGVNSSDGTLYVADTTNKQIKKITKETEVSVFLDTNGLASYPLNNPEGICVDANGNVFVNNTKNHNIIQITAAGSPSIYAGANAVSGTTNGAGTAARFFEPEGIYCGSSNTFYVADVDNNQIRKISDAAANVTLYAGSNAGTAGFINGASTDARFYNPKGITADSLGNVYVADNLNHVIRKISTSGDVTTLAGSTAGTSGNVDGTGTAARFNKPYALTIDASGNIYATDSGNHSIRKITQAGVVTTISGSGTAGTIDGAGKAASMNDPRGITYDTTNRVIYVSCAGDNKIRKISNL